MYVRKVILLGKQPDRHTGANQDAVLYSPALELRGMFLPAGEIAAVEERDEAVLRRGGSSRIARPKRP